MSFLTMIAMALGGTKNVQDKPGNGIGAETNAAGGTTASIH